MSPTRRDLAALLGLALAGCSSTRPDDPLRGRRPEPPVAIESLPSIHQAINGGLSTQDASASWAVPDRQPVAAAASMPMPDGGRPAEGVDRLPIASEVTPGPAYPFGPDPVLGSHPNAVPDAGLPPLPDAPADESAGLAAAEAPRFDPAPRSGFEIQSPPSADPALGAHPNAFPPADLPNIQAPSADPALGAHPNAFPPADLPMLPASPEGGFDTLSDPLPLPTLEAEPRESLAPVPSTRPEAGLAPGSAPAPIPAAPAFLPPPVVPAPEPPAPADEAIRQTSDSTAIRSDVETSNLARAGQVAAQVGDDVITLLDLSTAVREQLRKAPPGAVPSPEERNMLAGAVLTNLIDRKLILQEAKRQLKGPGMDKFKRYIDQRWEEEELPHLIEKAKVPNKYVLKHQLAEKGESLDRMHADFQDARMAREFMEMKLVNKLKVDRPEMLDYYNEHLDAFERGAEITWRELAVDFDKHPDRAAARRKIDALAARLDRGEDFARLAQAESDGPSRSEGGTWKTSPGSFAVAAINEALDNLPINQISPVIEGPTGYHIIRVEGRREAGAARFDEVQDQVRNAIGDEKFQREMQAYLEGLRADTLVRTIFDGTESAPRRLQPR